ncbi:MAG: diacylglycerol kinase family protein [Rhizomicrobium sp.]
MSAFAIVNPHSGNGRTGREWKEIARALGPLYPRLAVAFSEGRGDAMAKVRQALAEGHEEIVAVGGDGTINEAVNGMFDCEGALAPDAVFAFVTSGTGGDFRKSFGIEAGARAAVARLAKAPVRAVDIGRVSCLSARGEPTSRYFINIASFGMSGQIVQAVNRARIAKLFGGSFAFAFHSVLSMLRYRDAPVRLIVDGKDDAKAAVSTVAIANGQYFGGGMRVAPDAKPRDGLFDVVVMEAAPRGTSLANMKLIYSGEHVHQPHVRVLRGTHVVAAPVAETGGRPVWIETDGETAGRLPATFDILPGALNLRC